MSISQQDPKERLLKHLLNDQDEEQRQRLELAALADDDLFDQLRAAEAELVQSYVQGELDDDDSARLAELVGRSERLQENAETTLALQLWESEVEPAVDRDSQSGTKPTPLTWNMRRQGLVALLLLALSWVALARLHFQQNELNHLRSQVEALREDRKTMEAELRRQGRKIERLQQEQLRSARRWAEEATSE